MNAYKLYFDYSMIRLNGEGQITNPNDCVWVAEYEWNEETEAVGSFIRRVDCQYCVKGQYSKEIPVGISLDEMESKESFDECYDSVQEALDALDEYLEQYIIWRTIYGGYYEPDEYECTGLEDRDEIYYRVKAWTTVNREA